MENKDKNDIRQNYTVDLMHIVKTLWRRVWIIILAGLLAGGIGFSVAAFLVAPQYSSSIMLYVNNNSSSSNTSISASDLSAAQSLVKTYIVMLKNPATLNAVIEKTGVNYTYEQLSDRIEAESVDDTEVMRVTVTTGDPYEAFEIAQAITEIMPERISEILEGASMSVVDSGTLDLEKTSPSITKYTVLGAFIGIMLAAAALVLAAVLDDTIHDEEYVIQTYKYPILAKVPDLLNSDAKSSRYYYQKRNTVKISEIDADGGDL